MYKFTVFAVGLGFVKNSTPVSVNFTKNKYEAKRFSLEDTKNIMALILGNSSKGIVVIRRQ